MGDILAVKQALQSRAQAVAEFLLPGGRRDGSEWRAGSISGESGKSLGVHLAGDKAGIWADFATGETGDLLDLWMLSHHLTLSEALDRAREFCGMVRPEPAIGMRKEYVRPPKPKCTKPTDEVLDYLREVRNIPQASIDAYRIAADGDRIIFPFLFPNGELAFAKARKAADGEKPIPLSKDAEPILFGWQALSVASRAIVITEGEIDAMSWHAYGHEALSVPFGGGKGAKQQWIENDYDRLDRFEKIYISTDMDEMGDLAAQEIMSRLGRHRCYRVSLPLKDANACLQEGVTKAVMDEALVSAKSYDPDGLRRADAYLKDVMELFWPSNQEQIGYASPFGKVGEDLMFRPGEVSIWTGASGSGKSQILSHCTVEWVSQGSRICIASLEMKPAQTLKRMVKQAGNIDRPTESYLTAIIDWLSSGLLIYERVGKAGVDSLLEVFDYARAKYGCDQFIIDSLMRLGIASDDYTGQEKAVFRIVDWAISKNVHVHLVAHSRKGEKGGNAPETEDIKGASEIGSNAFNIISVWRNRDHEDKVKAAKTEEELASLMDKAGVIMNVAKQRNGDFEGKIGLWFDQETYRYHSSYDRSGWGKRYVEHSSINQGDVNVRFSE
jgi:twinkle protein